MNEELNAKQKSASNLRGTHPVTGGRSVVPLLLLGITWSPTVGKAE